ncbi:MAG: phosphate/phosphite/phosphonate ABC transporter substrate-binding protein [Thioalkalispiraceae bacterium]|jgi:phosphonate transport system substrate-binding protein
MPRLHAQTEYTLGIVPQYDSRKISQIWQPLIDEINRVSGITLNLVGSPSIPAFERSFEKGAYDFAYMNPYHILVANQAQGYQPIIRDVGRQLYGIIVVRKDSPVTSLQDLEGKVVAFPAPNALGAALIPRYTFAKKFNVKIKPKYVKSHSSVYLNVLLRQAAAGGGVQKTLQGQPAELQDQLRVLYETDKVAPHPIAVHPRVPVKDVEKVRQAILAISKTKRGERWLRKIPINRAGEASLEDYAPLKDMGLAEFYVR